MENSERKPRPRELGLEFGVLKTGPNNAITDVDGVLVGQVTLSDDARGMHTGVTAIIPHADNIFKHKVPAGVFLGNAFGKMVGYPQIKELGNLETPIVLTNTLNLAAAIDGLIDYTFSFEDNGDVRSINCAVGETNDGGINDIRARFVKPEHVLEALRNAKSGPVEEGCVGAGTGTRAFRFKAGIGTASRRLDANMGGYTVGVLVQSNFGGLLKVGGVDGSGDFVIAFSTNKAVRVEHTMQKLATPEAPGVRNDDMTPLFMAAIEATEEAIINSLFAATDTPTYDGQIAKALPVDTVMEMIKNR